MSEPPYWFFSFKASKALLRYSHRPARRGERVDGVILDAAAGHTLVDIVVADSTCHDLVMKNFLWMEKLSVRGTNVFGRSKSLECTRPF